MCRLTGVTGYGREAKGVCVRERERRGSEIDVIRGKEGLAVSQLDLLIPQPWGKGVFACVCVCLVEVCQFQHTSALLFGPAEPTVCVSAPVRHNGVSCALCLYCSRRFNGAPYSTFMSRRHSLSTS